MSEAPQQPLGDVMLVTGMAGAGRSTAIHALEDAGWETLDNVPLSLLSRVIEPAPGEAVARLAIVIDSRTRGFSAEAVIGVIEALRARADLSATLVFLDASDEALLRRYAETRRRHPVAPDEDAAIGIARERVMLAALREHADLIVDSTSLSPHDLKADMQARFGGAGSDRLIVSIQSFGFRRGAPREADMVIDCRFLRNPHWEPALRPMTGHDTAVAQYVAEDPLFRPFIDQLEALLLLLLPAYRREGKAYFGLALGCTGGRHRSVAAAESLAGRLEKADWEVKVRHRDVPHSSWNI